MITISNGKRDWGSSTIRVATEFARVAHVGRRFQCTASVEHADPLEHRCFVDALQTAMFCASAASRRAISRRLVLLGLLSVVSHARSEGGRCTLAHMLHTKLVELVAEFLDLCFNLTRTLSHLFRDLSAWRWRESSRLFDQWCRSAVRRSCSVDRLVERRCEW